MRPNLPSRKLFEFLHSNWTNLAYTACPAWMFAISCQDSTKFLVPDPAQIGPQKLFGFLAPIPVWAKPKWLQSGAPRLDLGLLADQTFLSLFNFSLWPMSQHHSRLRLSFLLMHRLSTSLRDFCIACLTQCRDVATTHSSTLLLPIGSECLEFVTTSQHLAPNVWFSSFIT